MATIPFTDNYTDLSSNRGFQFKFFCQKCGNGYMSTFKANSLGTAASAAAGAFRAVRRHSSGGAAQSAEALQQMVAGPQHDAALKNAVEEIRPIFKQCSRCGKWVCEPVCWNKKAGLCEACAPDLDEEISSAQAQAAKSQVIEKVRSVDYVGQRDLAQVAAMQLPEVRCEDAGRQVLPRMRHGDRPEEEMRQLRRRGRRLAEILPGVRQAVRRLK